MNLENRSFIGLEWIIFYYLFGGLVLGFAYKKTQNLSVPILVHICYNCLSFF
ncbi:type II CAAX prenyl endopeptidase Rce1 family protein [Streptococcus infantis]|uniref:CPBP family glutamic-type intramembrane protease n=1 Tax=Streptococcus infantis TaxID=68892 RepID=UPI0039C4D8E2